MEDEPVLVCEQQDAACQYLMWHDIPADANPDLLFRNEVRAMLTAMKEWLGLDRLKKYMIIPVYSSSFLSEV